MTPKEKANRLVDSFREYVKDFGDHELSTKQSKQCALIAVSEIINSNPHSNPLNTDVYSTMDYWMEVKKIIETIQ